MAKSDPKKEFFDKTGHAGVFVTMASHLQTESFPLLVEGQPITAYAFDPDDPQRVYVTTLSPMTLDFLESPWFEVPAA